MEENRRSGGMGCRMALCMHTYSKYSNSRGGDEGGRWWRDGLQNLIEEVGEG